MKPEEEEELKRRQLQALRDSEAQQKANQGCLQGCGCLFVGLPIAIGVVLFLAWLWSLIAR